MQLGQVRQQLAGEEFEEEEQGGEEQVQVLGMGGVRTERREVSV